MDSAALYRPGLDGDALSSRQRQTDDCVLGINEADASLG
jgi:hypothetical protein